MNGAMNVAANWRVASTLAPSDLDGAEWRIPGERMKARLPHIVPLARQAVAILRELHSLTCDRRYLFPSVRSAARPMSDNTLNAALRRLGYTTDDMTAHGFRSMASTLLNEQGCWNRDAIERQLAHGERNEVRAAYNYAEYLPERRRMMQAWSDYAPVDLCSDSDSWSGQMEMDSETLMAEIPAAFPKVDMPSKVDLRFHYDGCHQCNYLSEYLDERRAKRVDGAMITGLPLISAQRGA
jgi:hypothetical protein